MSCEHIWRTLIAQALSDVRVRCHRHKKRYFIRHIRIRSVESILSAYAALTHLQLSGNEISVVQRRSFSKLRRLNFLDLSDNELGTLAYDAFEGLR